MLALKDMVIVLFLSISLQVMSHFTGLCICAFRIPDVSKAKMNSNTFFIVFSFMFIAKIA